MEWVGGWLGWMGRVGREDKQQTTLLACKRRTVRTIIHHSMFEGMHEPNWERSCGLCSRHCPADSRISCMICRFAKRTVNLQTALRGVPYTAIFPPRTLSYSTTFWHSWSARTRTFMGGQFFWRLDVMEGHEVGEKMNNAFPKKEKWPEPLIVFGYPFLCGGDNIKELSRRSTGTKANGNRRGGWMRKTSCFLQKGLVRSYRNWRLSIES